mgnify:CR=1 FL=1
MMNGNFFTTNTTSMEGIKELCRHLQIESAGTEHVIYKYL